MPSPVEAIEEYTAYHSETFQEVSEWDCIRFEETYKAFKKRQMVEKAEININSMIQAIWSNSSYDESKEALQKRQEFVDSLNQRLSDLKEYIYNGTGPLAIEELASKPSEEVFDNPFFQASKQILPNNPNGSDKINYSSVSNEIGN